MAMIYILYAQGSRTLASLWQMTRRQSAKYTLSVSELGGGTAHGCLELPVEVFYVLIAAVTCYILNRVPT